MFNHFKTAVRKAWHDIYYFFPSKKAIKFAMTCREATEKIDLKDQSKTTQDKIRVKLHVSLCQACNNYYSFSKTLSRAINRLAKSQAKDASDLDKLNTELLQKFTK